MSKADVKHPGTVTCLFSDLEQFTRLLRHLQEAYAAVLAAYRGVLRAVCRQWDGEEIDTTGDGCFVVFRRGGAGAAAARGPPVARASPGHG